MITAISKVIAYSSSFTMTVSLTMETPVIFSLIGTVFHGSSQNGSNIVPALLKIQEKQETSSTSEKREKG